MFRRETKAERCERLGHKYPDQRFTKVSVNNYPDCLRCGASHPRPSADFDPKPTSMVVTPSPAARAAGFDPVYVQVAREHGSCRQARSLWSCGITAPDFFDHLDVALRAGRLQVLVDEPTIAALRHVTGQVNRARRDGRTFARVDTEALAAVLQHVEDLTTESSGVCGFDMGEGDECLLDAGHDGRHS